MKQYKNTYRSETTRLKTYDYASAGWYHVVACTKEHVCSFGEVIDGEMCLSAVGRVAHRFCKEIPDHFDRAVLDTFIVMPNHVHAIIGLLPRENADNVDVETRDLASLHHQEKTPNNPSNAFGPLKPGSLQAIVHAYKSAVTRWARKNDHLTFAWQPRFYDRVIRNERELNAIRKYVRQNPLKWHLDRNHPDNQP